ncbi:anti-sigma factor [Nocardiopsis sp. RSe5-2]|uniref:Regulator of SigK n=1 Tax=Nocardiopsis endophytica TaxID=3018445 RepID=A0ABT4U790_9ACTN|nr:anti-sigma factor [Nocardiopsis endophytica]MDA2812816.1 anti-sigma factor [Nocardiopsis endophytica]
MSPRGYDVHGLTAAYALDALEEAERAEVEAHLEECEDCRRDLRDFRETAARLGAAEAVGPPDGLWERVKAEAARTRQLPPTAAGEAQAHADAVSGSGDASESAGGDGPTDRDGDGSGAKVIPLRSRVVRRLPWAVAAAAVAVALVLGAVTVDQARRMDDLQAHTAEVEALLAAPGTEKMDRPVSESDANATVFASGDHDTMMIMVKGLPPAPDGKAYQLWYVDDDGMRSAGMLEEDGDGMLTGMVKGMSGATQLGITMEPDTGMPEPSKEPMKVDV